MSAKTISYHATVSTISPLTDSIEAVIGYYEISPVFQLATYASRPIDLTIQMVAAPIFSVIIDTKNLNRSRKEEPLRTFMIKAAASPATIPGKCALRTVESTATRTTQNVLHILFPAATVHAVIKGSDYPKTYFSVRERVLNGQYYRDIARRVKGDSIPKEYGEQNSKGWRLYKVVLIEGGNLQRGAERTLEEKSLINHLLIPMGLPGDFF